MTAAKKVYTAEEVRKLCLESFDTGRRVERARHQSEADRRHTKGFVDGAAVAQNPGRYQDDLMALAQAAEVAVTRGHLTLIRGGKS